MPRGPSAPGAESLHCSLASVALHRVTGRRLLHAELPDPHSGALANVSAELEKLGAKIDAVEKEISDTEVDLRTAKESNDTGEVGRLSREKEQLRDEKKQLRDEKKQLRDKEKLLLEERKLLLERTRPPAAGASPRRSGPHMTAWPKCVAQARSQAF